MIFTYIRSLNFEERPDYQTMIDMLETAKIELRLSQTQFDWVILAIDTNEYKALKMQ